MKLKACLFALVIGFAPGLTGCTTAVKSKDFMQKQSAHSVENLQEELILAETQCQSDQFNLFCSN